MVIVKNITITPNPVDAGKTIIATVEIREEYPGVKRYANKYPHRYGEQK